MLSSFLVTIGYPKPINEIKNEIETCNSAIHNSKILIWTVAGFVTILCFGIYCLVASDWSWLTRVLMSLAFGVGGFCYLSKSEAKTGEKGKLKNLKKQLAELENTPTFEEYAARLKRGKP